MSTHTYFSNQSQRYSVAAAANAAAGTTLPSGASNPAANSLTAGTNGASAAAGGGGDLARPRSHTSSSFSRLSLSVVGTEKESSSINGAGNGVDGHKTVHPLRSTWVFWFRQQRVGKVVNYEEGINKISAFSSVESFWSLWTHLSRPGSLQPTTDYLLFHADVRRPVWEDPLNIDGGKWIIRLRKGVADRLWEDLVLALIGDQFEEKDLVRGCVLSVRSQEDILSIWHQNEKDVEAKARIKETIQRSLNLPPTTVMEYKTNNDSLHDKSSFRTLASDRST